MDGVLVDNSAIHCRAFDIMTKRYGVAFDTSNMSYYFGRGNEEILRGVLPAEIVDRVGVPALAAEKEAIYREIYAPSIRPVDGLVELLTALKAAAIPCAVGSSGPTENVEFVLSHCHIAEFFNARVDSSRVTRCKPDPEIFLTAAADLGCKPADCLVFEDAVAGIMAARSAGMKVVALTTSFPKAEIEAKVSPDLIVKDFRELTVGRLESL